MLILKKTSAEVRALLLEQAREGAIILERRRELAAKEHAHAIANWSEYTEELLATLFDDATAIKEFKKAGTAAALAPRQWNDKTPPIIPVAEAQIRVLASLINRLPFATEPTTHPVSELDQTKPVSTVERRPEKSDQVAVSDPAPNKPEPIALAATVVPVVKPDPDPTNTTTNLSAPPLALPQTVTLAWLWHRVPVSFWIALTGLLFATLVAGVVLGQVSFVRELARGARWWTETPTAETATTGPPSAVARPATDSETRLPNPPPTLDQPADPVPVPSPK